MPFDFFEEFMKENYKAVVLGAGSFGTVLANIIAENGFESVLWARDEAVVEEINTKHTNSKYLPKLVLDEKLAATSDLSIIQSADMVVFSIPSKAFRSVLNQAVAFLNKEQVLVSTTKGLDAQDFQLMSQLLREFTESKLIGVLSGPNLAVELSQKQLTASVIASSSEVVRAKVQTIFGNNYFRIYASNDIYGVELGGTLKNIYAIAAGMSAALGMGENTKSMIITRALAEMSRFALKRGGNPLTFLGLAGVGDLIVTCSSSLSRNYRVGFALGEGKTLEEAEKSLGQVAEGIRTIQIVKQKADEMHIYMPLVTGLHNVIFAGADPRGIAKLMMSNQQSSDVEFLLSKQEVENSINQLDFNQ